MDRFGNASIGFGATLRDLGHPARHNNKYNAYLQEYRNFGIFESPRYVKEGEFSGGKEGIFFGDTNHYA